MRQMRDNPHRQISRLLLLCLLPCTPYTFVHAFPCRLTSLHAPFLNLQCPTTRRQDHTHLRLFHRQHLCRNDNILVHVEQSSLQLSSSHKSHRVVPSFRLLHQLSANYNRDDDGEKSEMAHAKEELRRYGFLMS